ncbi:MAG: hypothetical protein LBS36_06945 [Oscillospiraceae bacterium]|jgi:hypothetical protein|nr:hypothetical protein [Oscillospiraceae bacterium]
MDFAEKSRVCSSLAAADHIAADKALLRTVQPADNLLHAIGSGADFDKQVLWILLDFCSVEEINTFRSKKHRPTVSNVSIVPSVVKAPAGENPEKKNSKKKTNTQILNGITSKMNSFKKQLSSIMTG